MKARAVDLRIEELVLDGFAPADRYRIAEAVESELARLFAEQGVPPSLLAGQAPALRDGASFEAARGAPAEQIGAQVARAIYKGLDVG